MITAEATQLSQLTKDKLAEATNIRAQLQQKEQEATDAHTMLMAEIFTKCSPTQAELHEITQGIQLTAVDMYNLIKLTPK